jgi:hypothetical protein
MGRGIRHGSGVMLAMDVVVRLLVVGDAQIQPGW